MADRVRLNPTILFRDYEDILESDADWWAVRVWCLFWMQNWRN